MSYSGPERRKGRAVYSRGPIVVALELLSAMTAILAVAALVISLTSQAGRIRAIQQGRTRAAEDSCQLVRGLVFAATPPRELARAQAYINATELRDCRSYGRQIVGHP